LREELETHLRIAIEERVARGENPDEARAAALRETGNPLLIADVTREKWGWQWFERLAQDLRYAVRQLRRSPGYTATAIITLTLAIGANTAIFGLVYAILLRSLPVERPDRIVQIKMLMTGQNGKGGQPTDYLAGKTYDVVKERQTLMSGLCAWDNWALNLHDASGTRPVPTANLTGDCFTTLGLHAALGRLFNEADDKRGGGSDGYAVVLGYDYWRSHLGGDQTVIGVLDFQDKKGVVVGVLEPGFQSVTVGDRPSIYVPSEISPPEDRHTFSAQNRIVLGRLKDGVTAAQVQAQIDPIFNARLKAEANKFTFFVFDKDGNRQTVAQTHLVAVPGRTGSSYLRWQYKEPLYLIEGLVALSLLVACAYLTTLAGARALARRRELAVRVALGASRTRLAAQLCCENLLLSLAGTGLGLLFAWGAGRVLVKMLDQPFGGPSLTINTAPTGSAFFATLTTIGIYGLLNYSVVRRRTEIGCAWRWGPHAPAWCCLFCARRCAWCCPAWCWALPEPGSPLASWAACSMA
jgi:predicted permease